MLMGIRLCLTVGRFMGVVSCRGRYYKVDLRFSGFGIPQIRTLAQAQNGYIGVRHVSPYKPAALGLIANTVVA
jgi:hypothetical protein